MKKLISVLLLIALFCTVFAGSAFALSEEEEALYEKYADLIALLEAGDYTAALDSIWSQMPAQEVEEVVITTDNFFDYYEESVWDDYIERDADGKITSIFPGDTVYKLKDEYASRLDWENSNVTIGVTGKFVVHRVKFDWETGERTVGDEADKSIRKAIKKYANVDMDISVQTSGADTLFLNSGRMFFGFSSSDLRMAGNAEPGTKFKFYETIPSELEVVNAEGSLFLYSVD